MISRPVATRFAPAFTILAAFLIFVSPPVAAPARADEAAQCSAGLGADGKLHSGADPVKVANACISAAGSGSPQAAYLAGLALEQGIGVSKNPTKAADWYRKAARKGHADAQFALGRMEEAKQKNDQALAWYAQAAL